MVRSVKELIGVSDFNTEEQLVIVELVEEYARRAQFDLVFPRKETVEKYKKYFKVQRSCNILVWKWLKMGNQERFAVLKDFNLQKHCSD